MAKLFNAKHLKSQRQLLRNNATRAEQLLWQKLKRSRLCGLKFRRQYSIGRFTVDFYLPSHNLVIEIDGPSHMKKAAIEKDKARTGFLKANGLHVLRFTNSEIYENMPAVLQAIVDYVGVGDE